MWLFQLAQMAEGPGHLVAVALEITFTPARGTDDPGDFLRHAGLFRNTYFHILRSLYYRMETGPCLLRTRPRGQTI